MGVGTGGGGEKLDRVRSVTPPPLSKLVFGKFRIQHLGLSWLLVTLHGSDWTLTGKER